MPLHALTLLMRLIALISVLLVAPIQAVADEHLPLAFVRDIPLPGSSSRFDYQSFDPEAGLLFIAHLGGSEIVVFDTKSQRVTATIPGISHVHGVLAVPALKRIFASATGTNEVVVIDEDTLHPIARVPGGKYPDGLSYAPEAHELFVSDEFGHALSIIDTNTNHLVASISTGGEVGNNQYDPTTKHVFANVQTSGQLIEVDTRSRSIAQRYAIQHCDSNHGLYIAPGSRLAFIACEDNARLVVWDMQQHKAIQDEEVGKAPDVLAFDPMLGRLYVASESGVLSVFQISESAVTKLGQGHAGPKAHSVAIDPRTHLVYLPLENVNGHPVLRVMKPF